MLAVGKLLRCSACEEAKPPDVKAEGLQVGNIDGSRVLEFLQERWILVFGRMHTHTANRS